MELNDDPTTTLPTQPAEAARPTDRRRGRRLIAVATGTTIALGTGGVAWAATTAPSPTPSTTSPDGSTDDDTTLEDGTPPDGDHPMIRHRGGFGFDFGTLHGEAVVETKDGVYETVASQRGTIDEISADSITVTSEDGYERTYLIDSASLAEGEHGPPMVDPADLEVGDEVLLVALVEGHSATVQRLIDVAALPTPPAGGPGEMREWRAPDGSMDAPESGTAESDPESVEPSLTT